MVSVDDTTKHEYLYDPNGNLTADYNKQIGAVHYNHLNLPTLVDLGNNNYIEYLYDAAGIKLRQKVYKDGGLQKETDYVGNFIYKNSSLKFIITDDGRLLDREDGSGYDYEYFIKDHLGNNRVVVKDSLDFASVQQEDHYYPFGMALGGQSWQNPLQKALNKYLYNGKELQDDLGLDWYDYGVRMYDPQLSRFIKIDPLAEGFPMVSPYQYAFNNPIRWIDLDGLEGVNSGISDPAIGYLYAKAQMGSLTDRDFAIANQIMKAESKGTLIGAAIVVVSVATFNPLSVAPGAELLNNTDEGKGPLLPTEKEIDPTPEEPEPADLSSDDPVVGKRRKNRLPDKGEPNTQETNESGTTTKNYGEDGWVQKQYNDGHQGDNVPEVEKSEHVHDYKPNPYHPEGKPIRQKGRTPKKNEKSKDKYKFDEKKKNNGGS